MVSFHFDFVILFRSMVRPTIDFTETSSCFSPLDEEHLFRVIDLPDAVFSRLCFFLGILVDKGGFGKQNSGCIRDFRQPGSFVLLIAVV